MELLLLYIFYFWIVLIHAFFIGVSVFSIWGNRMLKKPVWKVSLLLAVPLVFLEFYWIPFVKYLDFKLTTDNLMLLELFNTNSQTNLVDLFSFNWMHIFVFPLGGYLAYRVGKWSYFRTLNQQL